MQSGEVAPDYKLLRQIGNLCNRLPAAGRGLALAGQGNGNGNGAGAELEFEQAFLGEYSDGLVVTYLAAVSKLTSMAQDVTDKFAMAFADAGSGGGGGGGGGGGHHHPHSGPSAAHRALGGLGAHGGGAGGRSRR
jgi:hypothetical protein